MDNPKSLQLTRVGSVAILIEVVNTGLLTVFITLSKYVRIATLVPKIVFFLNDDCLHEGH